MIESIFLPFIASVIIGIMGAFTSKFWVFILSDGEIFQFIGDVLRKMYLSKNKFVSRIAKPLGLCIYCNCIWVSIFIFLIFNLYYGSEINYLFMVFGSIPTAHFVVDKFISN